jgi:non-specific serine/threonine protein kinase
MLPVLPLSVPDPRRPPSLRVLAESEAVALFVERARAAAHEFCLTEGNQVAVAEICRRVEGLPLAVELAAARVRALSPAEILHRLSDRFRLLSAGPRSAPARQQTLRACIEWSHELCTYAERLCWARLAVFAGGFDLDAAEGVCAGGELAGEDVLDLVSSLVDKSILLREEGDSIVRYRMLDTIREYGQDELRESGVETAVRRRHRDWYAELMGRADAEWIGPRQVAWLARLQRELPNLRAALEFCLTEPREAGAALPIATSLRLYWFARGLISEGREWLDRALAQQPQPTAERARALYAASMLAGQQNDFPAASAFVAEGYQVTERLGDAATRALFTLASGYLAGYRGDLHRSVALLDAVLDTFRADHNVPQLLETLFALAMASGGLGDATRALACHEEMLAITEPRGEVWHRSLSLWAYGLVERLQGHLQRAAELVRESLRLKRPLDDLLGFAWCLEALAWIAVGEQDPRCAATLLGAAEELWRAIGWFPVGGRHRLVGYHDECEQRARRALGEQAFQTAFQHGVGLSLADAIGYALNEKPEPARPPATAKKTALTRREQEVAELVAEGLTNRQIAARLVISQRTAETHVENSLAKLGFTTRTQLATWVTAQREEQREGGER